MTPLAAALAASKPLQDLDIMERFTRLDALGAADLRAIVYAIAARSPGLLEGILGDLAAYRAAQEQA